MISTRSVELVIDTVVCLTLAKWETVSGRFGGYLTTIRTKPGVAAKPGHIQTYNNVVMGWTEGSGLAAMMEILKRLNEAHPQT